MQFVSLIFFVFNCFHFFERLSEHKSNVALKKEQKPEKEERILTLTSHALVTAKILLNYMKH